MAVTDEVLSRLRRTLTGIFQLGKGGVQLKNSSGTLQVRNSADSNHAATEVLTLGVKDSGTANLVILQAPTLGANVTLTLPPNDGTVGQFLRTDGSGVLTWVDSVSNADLTAEETFTQASGTLTILTSPPANYVLRSVMIQVLTAAAGGAPTIDVGIAGTVGKFVPNTDVDLLTQGIYIIPVEYQEDGTPDNVIITVVASAQTFTGTVRLNYTNPS